MRRLVLIALLVLSGFAASYGQGCSVCTKTAAELGDKGARGLNGGIVYLAFLPLAIMGTIGYVWWRHSRSGES